MAERITEAKVKRVVNGLPDLQGVPHRTESVLQIMQHPDFPEFAKLSKSQVNRDQERAKALRADIGGDLDSNGNNLPPLYSEFSLALTVYSQLTSKK